MDDFVGEFKEIEEIESYVKLEGPTLKQFITKLVIYLGRDPNKTELNNDEQTIFIGESQKISRKHAKIYWNSKTGNWEMQVLSKNKAIINGVTLRKDDNPAILYPCSAIKIDKFKFYFFPAKREWLILLYFI